MDLTRLAELNTAELTLQDIKYLFGRGCEIIVRAGRIIKIRYGNVTFEYEETADTLTARRRLRNKLCINSILKGRICQ